MYTSLLLSAFYIVDIHLIYMYAVAERVGVGEGDNKKTQGGAGLHYTGVCAVAGVWRVAFALWFWLVRLACKWLLCARAGSRRG